MKKVVYKYPLPARSKTFGLVLPKNFKFLRVDFQGPSHSLQMWCEVVREEPTETFNFEVFGTGQEIPLGALYLTTFDDGPFVFHLYRV